MTRKELLEALVACAQKLGRPPRYTDLRKMTKITPYWIRKHFRDTAHACLEAGIDGDGAGSRLPAFTLLEDWGRVARKMKKLPTPAEYDQSGRFTSSAIAFRYESWGRVPGLFRALVLNCGNEEDWADVLTMIGPPDSGPAKEVPAAPPALSLDKAEDDYVPVPSSGQRRERRLRMDRPVYGAPALLPGLSYEPINELGVVCLFGMVAGRLGIQVERVQQAFPDCEAMREMEPGRWQRVRIEFEYASRSFFNHKHDTSGCDLIVCWLHNWPECPETLEVIELKRVVRGL